MYCKMLTDKYVALEKKLEQANAQYEALKKANKAKNALEADNKMLNNKCAILEKKLNHSKELYDNLLKKTSEKNSKYEHEIQQQQQHIKQLKGIVNNLTNDLDQIRNLRKKSKEKIERENILRSYKIAQLGTKK